MTTIVIWDVKESFHPDIPPGAILAISDSRTSTGAGVLTDNCSKIFEVYARCEIRNNWQIELSGPTENKSITVAIAGSTLVAHNVVFCLQQGLYRLVGAAMPTMMEIAEFAASVASRLTKEIGFQMAQRALSEVVLIGHDEDGIIKTISIKPSVNAANLYNIIEIKDYPYTFGSGSEKFSKEYSARSLETADESIRGQLPLMIFDELFLLGDGDKDTGGDLQMVATTLDGLTRFSPMRWNASKEAYSLTFYGEEISKKKIGNAHIAHHPWQLNDI